MLIYDSIHGATKSIEDSQEWMKVNMNPDTIDNVFYCMHVRDDSKEDGYGQHVGSICLRLRKAGPTFPPPNPLPEGKTLYFREMGYALFKPARGKGYCTEAGQGLLASYKKHRSQFNDKEVSWVEAIVGGENPGSINVLTKLGFQNLGKFTDVEPVFVAGAWRTDGYWVYGQYA
jgi:RimJ/RimL family protein N-acetyltransferase